MLREEHQFGFDFDVFESDTPSINPLDVLDRVVKGMSMVEQGAFYSDINSRGEDIRRKTCVNDIVDCYRNLNKPSYFSCRQRAGGLKGKVSGYANILVIENPEFVVSEVSRQRILRERSKNVHAFVRGKFYSAYEGVLCESLPSDFVEVSYSPYVSGSFYHIETRQPVQENELKRFAILFGSNVYLTDLNQA